MKLFNKWFGLLFVVLAVAAQADLPKTVKSADGHGDCQVEVLFQELTYGGTCYGNTVMTGISSLNPLEIYCSQLQVTCDHAKGEADDRTANLTREN